LFFVVLYTEGCGGTTGIPPHPPLILFLLVRFLPFFKRLLVLRLLVLPEDLKRENKLFKGFIFILFNNIIFIL